MSATHEEPHHRVARLRTDDEERVPSTPKPGSPSARYLEAVRAVEDDARMRLVQLRTGRWPS